MLRKTRNRNKDWRKSWHPTSDSEDSLMDAEVQMRNVMKGWKDGTLIVNAKSLITEQSLHGKCLFIAVGHWDRQFRGLNFGTGSSQEVGVTPYCLVTNNQPVPTWKDNKLKLRLNKHVMKKSAGIIFQVFHQPSWTSAKLLGEAPLSWQQISMSCDGKPTKVKLQAPAEILLRKRTKKKKLLENTELDEGAEIEFEMYFRPSTLTDFGTVSLSLLIKKATGKYKPEPQKQNLRQDEVDYFVETTSLSSSLSASG